jgi:hypothetical protein
MMRSPALPILTGIMFVLLIAVSASAREREIGLDRPFADRPVAADHERSRGSLDDVLNRSQEDRDTTDNSFRSAGASARQREINGDNGNIRAIQVEIGDELGGDAAASSDFAPSKEGHELHVKNKLVAKELEGEWKAVNKGFRKPSKQVSSHDATGGGASASNLPASRMQKSARFE